MTPTNAASVAQAAAPGASWSADARLRVVLIIAVATALKIAVCPLVGLDTNEAYAIASGRLMSLSYFDHPPLHFWLAHLCELIFGDNTSARVPFILLGAGTSWLMFSLTRQLFGERAGVWATLALNLSVFFDLVSGNWILPDGPLNFFLLATALALVPMVKDGSLGYRGWIAAGLFAGLAALSKYHAFLFMAGLLGFLLADPVRRRLLLTPGPWLASLCALALFSPVLIWNASNNWVSFLFQGGRAAPHHHLGWGLFLSLLVAQLAVLLPGALFALIGGIRQAFSERTISQRFLLWLGIPIVGLFTFVPLLSDNGMMHWAMPGWLMLMPLAGKYLADKSRIEIWPARFMISAATIFLLLTTGAALEFQTGWLGAEFPRLFKRGDPTALSASWSTLSSALGGSYNGDAGRRFVLTSGWREASKIDEGAGGKYRVLVASSDPRNFAVGLNLASLRGRDGWVVLQMPVSQKISAPILGCFAQTRYAFSRVIARNERPDATLAVFRADEFHPERCDIPAFSR